MANHVRQQVREAFATLLTGLPTTGARVYQSRIYPLDDSELPCLLIATNQEDISALDPGSNPALERQLSITVTAVAKANSNLDDTLDTVIKEVEVAANSNLSANTLANLVKGLTLQNLEIGINGDAEKPVGQAVMTFNTTYYTQASAPDVSI